MPTVAPVLMLVSPKMLQLVVVLEGTLLQVLV